MSQVKEILVLHHSHFDAGYTHPQPVLWELERRFIDEAINLCETTADLPEPSRVRWTCECSAPLLHWLRSASDRQLDRFSGLVKAGQISVSAMFCNATPLYDAEEFARSLYPVRELRERFGLPVRVAMNHDVNGIPWPAVGMLLDAGVELLVMGINIHFGGFPLHRPLAFRWRGPDGRAIHAFNGEHYGAFDRELRITERSTHAMADGFEAYLGRLSKAGDYPYDFVYLTATHPHHIDNNPPNPDMAALVARWNQEERAPLIRFIAPEGLLERISAQPASTRPEHAGDWTDYWNFGAASAAHETAINRRARARMLNGELIRSTSGKGDAHVERIREEAWWNIFMYDEHTWGAAASITASDEENVAAQWNHKANHAFRARDNAALYQRDALEALSGNAAQGQGTGGVLFFNPSPVARTECVRIPNIYVDGGWQHIASWVCGPMTNQDGMTPRNSRVVGPLELPPYSWRVVEVSALEATPQETVVQVHENDIESPFHRLSFDRATGRITGLFDKQQAWEVLDSSSPWSFFGYVQETVDAKKDSSVWPFFQRGVLFTHDWRRLFANLSCWNPDWPAVRNGPSRLLSCETENVRSGVSLVLRWAAPGVDLLEQRITLSAHKPSIELHVTLRKLDVRDAEAIYFAFPLHLRGGWRAHYDTAGLPVELDAEQLPGVVRDWITADTWVSVHEGDHGVTLACPDAPLFQIGGFHFSKGQNAVPRNPKPLLLAWPMNNYWTTNFRASQPGACELRYELLTHGRYSPVATTALGLQAARPVEAHPVLASGALGPTPLVEVEGVGIVPVHVKAAEHGAGVIVRVRNVLDAEHAATLRLPGGIARASRTSILEEDADMIAVGGDGVTLPVPARGIVTVRLLPKPT